MQTISPSHIPATLGARDRIVDRSALMAEGAAQHEADSAPMRDHLLRCFTASLRTGDASSLVTFAKPNPTTKKLYTLAEVVQEGIECADLTEAIVQTLMNGAKGQDVQAACQFLLTAAAAKWSSLEAEERL